MSKIWKKYEKHQKKILAIFSVGLMIAFALPASMSGSGRRDIVRGTIGGHTVTASQFANARNEWDFIREVQIISPNEKVSQPLFSLIGESYSAPGDPYSLSNEIAARIQNNPDLFYLLLREANDMGVAVNQDTIETAVKNCIPPSSGSEADLRSSIRDVLMINGMLERVAQTVQVSNPLIDPYVAIRHQELSVNFVTFNAKDYQAQALKPSLVEVTAFYDQYKDVDPATSPDGIGYRLPDRVKVQYLALRRIDVLESVRPTVDEIAARTYYHLHTSLYTTAPTKPPSAGPFDLTEPASATPTTLPFDAVRDRVYNELIAEKTEQRMDEISKEITSQLASDYAVYKQAVYPADAPPATGPATQTVEPPHSPKVPYTLGVRYDTYDYMQRLAAQIQKKDHAEPQTHELKTWMSAKDLAKLDGIGAARTPGQIDRAGSWRYGIDFSTYATQYILPLAVGEHRASRDPKTLALMEGSPALSDDVGDLYFFRVTAADPAHAPPEYTVSQQVEQDVLARNAMKLTTQAAEKLMEKARHEHLTSAAAAENLKVVTTGLFSGSSNQLVENVPASDRVHAAFIAGAFKLLLANGGGIDREHPVGLIELPELKQVLVAEVNEVHLDFPASALPVEEFRVRKDATMGLRLRVLSDWCSLDSIAARLDYLPAQSPDKEPL